MHLSERIDRCVRAGAFRDPEGTCQLEFWASEHAPLNVFGKLNRRVIETTLHMVADRLGIIGGM
jgi:hypothetical protein